MRAPVYSHLVYDVMPNHWVEIDRPEILIVEGLNVLQTGRLPRDGKAIPFVSDFFDFSVYLDADETCSAMVCRALPGAARDRVPRSQILFPPLFAAHRRGGGRDRDLDLDPDQSRQSAREHPADPPARRPHPQEGARPTRSGSRAAASCDKPHKGRGGLWPPVAADAGRHTMPEGPTPTNPNSSFFVL